MIGRVNSSGGGDDGLAKCKLKLKTFQLPLGIISSYITGSAKRNVRNTMSSQTFNEVTLNNIRLSTDSETITLYDYTGRTQSSSDSTYMDLDALKTALTQSLTDNFVSADDYTYNVKGFITRRNDDYTANCEFKFTVKDNVITNVTITSTRVGTGIYRDVEIYFYIRQVS